MIVAIPKHHLNIATPRCPTYLERLLLGIKCIGFCASQSPENVLNCLKVCGSELYKKLGRSKMYLSSGLK